MSIKHVGTDQAASESRGRLASANFLTTGFHALSIRNFRLWWVGQLISQVGTWMQSTAQAWLVYQLTNSAFDLGLVTTLQFLPVTLLALFGGVIADRVRKRNLMVVTQTLFLVQATVFGVLVGTGSIRIWHVYVLALVQGLINAVDNPVRQALPVELVKREDVGNAIALNSMLFNAARIVGPSLAGLVIFTVGIAATLYLNAVSFIAVIIALLMMDATKFFIHVVRPMQPAVLKELYEGLVYSVKTPLVFTVLLVIAGIGTFGYNFSTVLPLLGGFVLHTDAAGFGILSTAIGVGSFIGAMYVAYNHNFTPKRLFVGSVLFSIFLAAVALSNVFAISDVLLVALGFAGILFTTTANTLLQMVVPDELRGRVMSLYVLLFMGSTPIGALFTGTMATAIGVPDALLVEAAICAVSLVIAGLYYQLKVRIPRREAAL